MICQGCGEKNRESSRFCMFCGGSMTPRCPVCDTDLVVGARFCDACGTPIEARPADIPASRKIVTVLFSDLTGSTALEEGMDAESVRSIVERFYALLRAETERYGGTVVKFTGDGAMSVFGVPEVNEDDAVRAIDAALAMRTECEQLAGDLGLPLALKIGVNTGEVVVHDTDEDIVGDCVNVAARLESIATSGEIVVGEETWRLTRATSRYEPMAPLTLKGKSEPVQAYRLLSVDERTTDSAATPFVGRATELGRLRAAFDDAVASRSARLVTIIGAPGLGKTRLARELMAQVESDGAGVRETRCVSAGSTFAPIADALRAAADIADDASVPEVRDALIAMLPADDPEAERIAARAAAILGAGEPGTTEETFWALRKLLEAAAATSPVVLVLDDLHWAEPVLLDLIEHLAEWTRDAAVLLVGTGRPELREQRPSFAEGGRALDVIALEGLDDGATAELALNLLGTDELPDELLAKIPASTQGNPLFVRELVRMLVDDGVLQRTPGGWTVTVDVDAIEVPPTISSLLAARVDRLRSDERTFIELAAVVGKEFYRGALLELAPPSVRDQLDGCLESLRRKELVEPAGTYWIDEPVYHFHHALIRDAAYRRVLKQTRADFHERVAGWFEAKTRDVIGEHDEMIGFHLEQAHECRSQLGSVDDELARRAALLLGSAARRALDRDDLPAAASLSKRALTRLPDGDAARAELLLVQCEALLSMGDVTNGTTSLADLERIADTGRLAAWVRCFQGQLANLTAPERLRETEALVAVAARELSALGDDAGAAKAHTVHASTLAKLGRFAECETVLDAGLNAARDAGDHRRITAVLGAAPHATLWGPSPVSRAGGRCLDIIRLLRITTGSLAVEATSNRCQAVLEAFRGRGDAARRMLRNSRRPLIELGLEHELLEADLFAGIIESVSGDASAAQAFLQRAYSGFIAEGVDVLAAQAAALLARAFLQLGDDAAAERSADESRRLAGQDLKASIAWRSVTAEVLARRGEVREARQLAEAAVEIASNTDALIDTADACRALSLVHAAAGDTSAARKASERARALYERKGATAFLDAQPPTGPASGTGAVPDRMDHPVAVAYRNFYDAFIAHDTTAIGDAFAEDGIVDDRRPGLRDVHEGRERIAAFFAGVLEVGVTQVDFEVITVRGDHLGVIRAAYRGEAFETHMFNVGHVDADGRFLRGVIFDDHDVENALAELNRLAVVNDDLRANTAARVCRQVFDLVAARDWDGLASVYAEGAVSHDMRPGMKNRVEGRDAVIEDFRTMVEVGLRRIDTELLAVRGDRQAMMRATFAGEAFEAEAFIVVESDADGRAVRGWTFDDVVAAGEQLDRSPIAPSNLCSRRLDAFLDLSNRREIDAACSLNHPDIEIEDRRPGLGSKIAGAEAVYENLQQALSFQARIVWTVEATRGERLAMVSQVWRGPDPDPIEARLLTVIECDESGLFTYLVQFDPGQTDEALAELEARHAAMHSPRLENRCTRAVGELFAAFERRDIEAFLAMHSETFLHDDDRTGVRQVSKGREEIRRLVSAHWDLGGGSSRAEVLAVRGERLSLTRRTYLSVDDAGEEFYEGPQLIVDEIDEDGLAWKVKVFDPDDLDAAFAELNRRYLESLDPALLPTAEIGVGITDAYNARDWDGFASLIEEDFVLTDRVPVAAGRVEGRANYLEHVRGFVALAPDARLRAVAIHALRPGAAVVQHRIDGHALEGGAIDFEWIDMAISADGRLVATHQFVLEDLGEALLRFGKIAAPELDNAAVRHSRRITELLAQRDWDPIRDMLSDRVVNDDRRAGLHSRTEGREAHMQSLKLTAELGASNSEFTPLAIRGERSALWRCEYKSGGEDPYIVETLEVDELDDDGRLALVITFAPEDVDAAFAELDERHLAGEGARDAASLRLVFEGLRSINARDWDGIISAIPDDFSFVDHRPASLGALHSLQELVAAQRALLELVPDMQLRIVRVPAAERHTNVVDVVGKGSDLAGTPVEFRFLCVSRYDGSALTVLEYYPPEAEAEAIARFDELIGYEPSRVSNACTRQWDAVTERFEARDWRACRETIADDIVFEDRRAGLQLQTEGIDPFMDLIRAIGELDPRSEHEHLATRGDRHALIRMHWHSDDLDGPAVDALHVHEIDESGRLARSVIFDTEDLADAYAELDRSAAGI